jgi:RHS repeat-associated protein
MLTDEDDVPVWRANYEAFGKASISADPDGSIPTVDPGITFNIRFPGQYYDAESGLHYNRFRYYEASVGRYISGDPIGQRGGLNLYSYVFNDPINRLDPLGLDPPTPHTDPRTFDDDREIIEDMGGGDAVDFAEKSFGGLGGAASCEVEFSSCRGECAANSGDSGSPTMADCQKQLNDCLRKKRDDDKDPLSATPEGDASRESGSRNAVTKYSRGRGKKVDTTSPESSQQP